MSEWTDDDVECSGDHYVSLTPLGREAVAELRMPGRGQIITGPKLLDTIRTYQALNGFAPSVREMARLLYVRDPSTVQHWIDKLVGQGQLQRTPGIARSLRVVESNQKDTALDTIEHSVV